MYCQSGEIANPFSCQHLLYLKGRILYHHFEIKPRYYLGMFRTPLRCDCRVKSPWDMSAVPSFFFLSHKSWLFDDILLDKEEREKIPGFFFTLFYFDSIST